MWHNAISTLSIGNIFHNFIIPINFILLLEYLSYYGFIGTYIPQFVFLQFMKKFFLRCLEYFDTKSYYYFQDLHKKKSSYTISNFSGNDYSVFFLEILERMRKKLLISVQ